MQRLLVTARGPNEAIAAAQGGANIADVEHHGSVYGTPFPLNIKAARDVLAGSIGQGDSLRLWTTGINVVCVRGAACERLTGNGRYRKVSATIVASLSSTLLKLMETDDVH